MALVAVVLVCLQLRGDHIHRLAFCHLHVIVVMVVLFFVVVVEVVILLIFIASLFAVCRL